MYKNISANEVDSKYIGSDCAQVMIPFDKSLSIFSETNLTFYGRGYRENKVDNSYYIQDARKKQFPYSDTPYHWTRKNLLSKVLYVNQLFDFNRPYILINNGTLSECYVANGNGRTYVIQTDFAVENKDAIIKKYIEKERVYDFFGGIINNDDGRKTYIVDSTGKHLNICFDENERRQKRNELIEFLKQKKMLYNFDENNIWYHDGEYILEDNFLIPCDNPLFMIKLSDSDMQIKHITISSLNEDIVKVIIYNIPVEKYNLEQISEIVKGTTKKLKEPVFSKTLRRK